MGGRGRTGEVSSTRATRGGRLDAPPCRFHKGSGAGPVARIAFLPVPDAENAGVRRPPFPRPGNSPCSPNAPAAPAETQGAEWADGRSAIGWKAREASGCDRPRRPDAHAHAGHASRTLFANATAAIFLRSLSNAEYATAAISLCRICYCSYYVGYNATAAYLLHIMTTVDITTVDITTAAILTSHTHNVLPTHLIPSSLKVSHRSSPLPP